MRRVLAVQSPEQMERLEGRPWERRSPEQEQVALAQWLGERGGAERAAAGWGEATRGQRRLEGERLVRAEGVEPPPPAGTPMDAEGLALRADAMLGGARAARAAAVRAE